MATPLKAEWRTWPVVPGKEAVAPARPLTPGSSACFDTAPAPFSRTLFASRRVTHGWTLLTAKRFKRCLLGLWSGPTAPLRPAQLSPGPLSLKPPYPDPVDQVLDSAPATPGPVALLHRRHGLGTFRVLHVARSFPGGAPAGLHPEPLGPSVAAHAKALPACSVFWWIPQK